MKKYLLVILSLLLAASLLLSACGSEKEPAGQNNQSSAAVSTAEKSEQPAKNVTLKLWIYPSIQGLNGDGTGEYDDWAKDRASKFKAMYPNVTVETELLNWQGGTEKVDVSVASGNTPDLTYAINSLGGVTKYAKMGALEAVDGYLNEADWEDYSTAVTGSMKFGDKHYMIPWLKLVSAIAVNIDIFKERNAENLLPLNKELRDWTFDEFLAAAKATTFSRSGGSRPDVYGYSLWGKDGPFYMYLFSPLNGGNIVDDSFGNYVMNSSESIEGLQFMVDLANVHKVIPEGAAGLSIKDINDMFLQGQIAMMPAQGSTGMIADAQKAPKPFNVEFVSFPHGANAPLTSWNNVGGFIVFKQSDEYKKEVAMEFGKFITNVENSQILKHIGCFPARMSAGNIYGDDKNMEYFSKLADYGNSIFSRAFGLISVSEWEINLQALLLKSKTPEQVTQELESKVKEAIAE